MHRVRKILQIQGKVVYSFLLLGIGIGVVIIIVYFFFLQRIETQTVYAEIFPEGAKYATNQIIVKYKSSYAPHVLKAKNQEKKLRDLDEKLKKIGVLSQRKLFTSDNILLENYYVLNLPPDSNIPDMYLQISKFEEIDSVTPDYILTVQEVPDDPAYASLWGLKDIYAPQAWDLENGGSSVIVGVVDTGVDSNHEDLRGKGRKGKKFIEDSNNPEDDHGHGTHVAGTIGAITNNGIGISSISWGTKLLAIKSCNENGDCKTSDVVRGIKYAIDNGAKIVNVSVAGEGSCRGTYGDVLSYVKEKDVVMVVAAGNGISGNGVDAQKWIPAGCENSFTVGAVGPSGKRAQYSNYGEVLSISAPGGDRGDEVCTQETCILSTSSNNTYALRQGTSMAAPQVSGTAALLLAYNPNLSASQIKKCIIDGGDTMQSDKYIGNILNSYNALRKCAVRITPTPIQTIEEEGELSISGIVYEDVNDNKQFDANEKEVVGAQVVLSGYAQDSALSNSTGRFLFSKLKPGFYTLSVSVQGKSVGEVYDISLNQFFPNVQINLPVPKGSIPKVNATVTPIPTQKASSIQCVPDPACKASDGISICTLKCE